MGAPLSAAPSGDEPPVREATHAVPPRPDAWPAKAARHRREWACGAAGSAVAAQLNVPGSPAGAAGSPAGWLGTTAPSQQGAGPADGPHGSHTGPHGAAIGAWQGSP